MHHGRDVRCWLLTPVGDHFLVHAGVGDRRLSRYWPSYPIGIVGSMQTLGQVDCFGAEICLTGIKGRSPVADVTK